jgi:hypothetical protein
MAQYDTLHFIKNLLWKVPSFERLELFIGKNIHEILKNQYLQIDRKNIFSDQKEFLYEIRVCNGTVSLSINKKGICTNALLFDDETED